MFQTDKLTNGITVVMEKIPYVKSVSFGVWVKSGSAYEEADVNGISHFIEHMVFKGTRRRSAQQIAQEMDNIGGQMNAFTSKENTCFYTKTLDSHLDISVDLLCDMLFHAKFSARDIETEKRVVGEEIDMYEDTPDELVYDLLSASVWQKSRLGQPVLGTKETLMALDAGKIRAYMQAHYTAENMVLSVAGNIQFKEVLELLENTFGKEKPAGGDRAAAERVLFRGGTVARQKDIEQTHICLGFESVKANTDDSYTQSVINTILGGSMGSRLFQKIREQKGLVYTICSFPSSYENAGLFNIYAATNPKNVRKVVSMIAAEIETLKREKFTTEEISKAKEQLKCGYILGMESVSSRMSYMGKSQLMLGRIKTQEEVLEKCDGITKESVDSLIDRIFQTDHMGLCVVGALPKKANFSDCFLTE